MSEWHYLSIAEAARGLREGKFGVEELTEHQIDRIERLNPKLNAYLQFTPEIAREMAKAQAKALKENPGLGPLAGIPIGLKDLYDVKGLPTSAGSPIPSKDPKTEDSAVAGYLREAGAVFTGKNHLHEWALGVLTKNPHFGDCHNPWNLAHSAGGSSGGSAAAVAAGLCFGSFGTDTGGSIRIPSSLCGIVGLKPTYGRISLRGIVPLSPFLDHAGPLARTVEDAAILFSAVDRFDPEDPAAIDCPRDDVLAALRENGKSDDRPLAGVRVLLEESYFFPRAVPEVARAVEVAIRAMERLGAKIERISLPGVEGLSPTNVSMIVSDAAMIHAEDLRERPHLIGEDVRTRMLQSSSITASEYARFRLTALEWRHRFESLLAGDTVLVAPATPITAPVLEGTSPVSAAPNLTAFTGVFNLTGLPALSVPCGFDGSGLPIGLQIVARPWAESLTLRVGAAFEKATDWHIRRPGV